MNSKTKYGIPLCRYNPKKNNVVEILLIKRRYSYHFLIFVMCYYKKTDIEYLRYLLDNMSFAEKIDIISMQYSQMWYRICLNNPEKYFNITDVYKTNNFSKHPVKSRFSNVEIHKLYYEKKSKFEQNFLSDNGIFLRKLVQQSSDAEIIWEIPKGGKNRILSKTGYKLETDIDCAIREFYEETSISNEKFRILYDVEPVVDSFIDDKVRYTTIYHIATLRNPDEMFTPHIDFRNFDQITEVEQIKWVSLEEIRFFNLPKSVHDRLINLYIKIIKLYKKSNKFKKLA